jgi:hypothetical protein
MTMLKKLVGGLATVATVASLAVLPTFVFADDTINADNITTGYRSRNRNVFDVRHNQTSRTRRDATVRNTLNVVGDTGENDQNGNTNAGNQNSGEVEVTGTIDNLVNETSDTNSVLPENEDVRINTSNDTTGPRSRNVNRATVRNTVDVRSRYTADVRNTVDVNGATGDNNQNSNTDGGSQTSGEVDVDFNLFNTVNSPLVP